jgi:hypothetical protein
MASGVGTALKCRCAAIDNAAIDHSRRRPQKPLPSLPSSPASLPYARSEANQPYPADRAEPRGLAFFLRLRDQIRLNQSPSSSSKWLAKIGTLKLGASSLNER